MSLTIGGLSFDHHHYDERGDVLYLSVHGADRPPANAVATAEGHGIEYDDDGRIVSLTLVNVRWLLDRVGEVEITWPVGHLSASELSTALQSAV